MAPQMKLAERDYCGYGSNWNGNYCDSSNWYYWGRWVVLGVIILAALVLVFLCTCVARRRRRRGVVPMYGTGWMAPRHGKFGVGYNQYEMNNQGGYNPPPAYGQQQPQYTGTTFNPDDGYYGQQPPQSPANVYQQNQGGYAPPTGPPPGKTGY